MKFYVGGGWLTWHHEQAVGKDIQNYYLNFLRSFKNIRGFYFEPTGEPENDGRSAESPAWREESDGLHQLIETVMRQQATRRGDRSGHRQIQQREVSGQNGDL